MDNDCMVFQASNKAKVAGIALIIMDLLLIAVNTKISWKIVGVIILIGSILEEIEIFCLRVSVNKDGIIIKSLFENKYLQWSEVKKIYMRSEFRGKLVTIEIEGIIKKTSITFMHENYQLITKLIVQHCRNNKLTYITEEVLKFIEE